MRRVVGFLLLLGCGPNVAVPGTGSTGAGGTASDAEMDSEVTSSSPSAVTSDSSSPSTTRADTSSTSTTEVDPSTTLADTTSMGVTTGVEECMSCDGDPIGANDVVDEGFSPQDVVDDLDGLSVPLQWEVDAPPTTLNVSLSFTGDARDVPGDECCDPCNFIYVPCPGGLTFDGQLGLTTDDGLLQEMVTAHVYVLTQAKNPGANGQGIFATLARQDIMGTLPEQTMEGQPFDIGLLTFDLDRDEVGGEWVVSVTLTADAGVLGSTP